ncbi:helix-turn-helix transcriptional regulator [Actinomyces howellii]|uniref:HTH domain n=1 Tax=Actinomyces howellii TaxID=52771 RepID=A0A448HIU7_9ACTO|nr:WYL domain-containing protein [Actinomyces howellii]VEG29565.1 HTH domain [Actinomyces howellii]
MRRAERLHALSEALRRSGHRGRTAAQLAQELEVSVRTIKRDLAALEASGLPLWSRPGPGGGYGMLNSGTLPPVTLTDAQALSLLAAVAAAPDAPYSDLAAAAVGKIMDVLDPGTRARVDQLATRVWVNRAPGSLRSTRSACEQAMVEQRVLRIEYVDAHGVASTRDVEPILFANTHGTWYLVGWCRLREAVRWFTIHRIQRASVTREECTGHTVDEIGTPPATATSVRPMGR